MEFQGLPEYAGGVVKELPRRKIIFVAAGLFLMFGAGYMLYPKESLGIKLVSEELVDKQEISEMEKPVSKVADISRGRVLRNPFSPEHELRENMPKMLAMEKRGASEAGISGANEPGRAGGIGGVVSAKGSLGSAGTSGQSGNASSTPRLTGILHGENENLAIFSIGGKSFTLASGESQNGLSLISLEGEVAVAEWNGATLRLELN